MNDFTRISAHYSTRPTGTAEIYNGDSSDHVVLYGQKPAKPHAGAAPSGMPNDRHSAG